MTINFFIFFKMAARFAVVTEEEIEKIKEDSIPQKTKEVTKYGVKIFQGKMFSFFLSRKTGFVAAAKRWCPRKFYYVNIR